jgi:hypothetical protein
MMKINKTGIMLAVIHAVSFVIFLGIFNDNFIKSGWITKGFPSRVVWAMTIISIADFPIILFFDFFKLNLTNSSDILVIGLFGTIMWFFIGVIFQKGFYRWKGIRNE